MSTELDTDEIWNYFFAEKQIQNQGSSSDLSICCKNPDLTELNGNLVCTNCGQVNDQVYSSYVFTDSGGGNMNNGGYTKTNYVKKSKITKLQEWSNWTNIERNEYKLKLYTTALCEKLNIPTNFISNIVSLVTKVISTKSKTEGPKRSRVKDGIIISCINYISKSERFPISTSSLAKKINLDTKYISRGDRILMEMSFLDHSLLNSITSPMDHIYTVTNNFHLDKQIPELKVYLEQTSKLIDYCEENDILYDHTPISIGVACLYYILYTNNYTNDLNLKTFSYIFELSNVTVTKTFNKLKKNLEKVGYTNQT